MKAMHIVTHSVSRCNYYVQRTEGKVHVVIIGNSIGRIFVVKTQDLGYDFRANKAGKDGQRPTVPNNNIIRYR
jgi:hypothetical protein